MFKEISNLLSNYKLTRNERIKDKKTFGKLFTENNSLFCYPFKLLFAISDKNEEIPVQVAFAIPRRKVKKAHQRNRIRRLAKESYRYRKNKLWETCKSQNISLKIMFIYTSDTIHQQDIPGAIDHLMEKLMMKIRQHEEIDTYTQGRPESNTNRAD